MLISLISLRKKLGIVAVSAFVLSSLYAQNIESSRVWVSQAGTSLTAQIVAFQGGDVSLKTEDGRVIKVPLSQLSSSDREYVGNWVKQTTGMAMVVPPNPIPSPAGNQPLLWPARPVTDPPMPPLQKLGNDKNGPGKGLIYVIEPFQITSEEEVSDAAIKEIVKDYLLVYKLFQTLPWDWQPRPLLHEVSPYFVCNWYEVDPGPMSVTSDMDPAFVVNLAGRGFFRAGSEKLGFIKSDKGDLIMDPARELRIGNFVSNVTTQMLAGKRGVLMPWVFSGLDYFFLWGVYNRGVFDFSKHESGFKLFMSRMRPGISQMPGPDLERMIKVLRLTPADARKPQPGLSGRGTDGMFLMYFFGFLDGDGKGTRFHQYMREVARESRKLPSHTPKLGPEEFPFSEQVSDKVSLKLIEILTAGRSDKQLQTEIQAKYKAIGIEVK